MMISSFGGIDEIAETDRQAAPVAAVLAGLDVRRNEQVLIMLPDGPGFAEFFAGAVSKSRCGPPSHSVVYQVTVSLPVSPQLSAHDLAAAGAWLVLASPDPDPRLAPWRAGRPRQGRMGLVSWLIPWLAST
jgi:acyl-CoA synthetase (AMP-forming)/AMP-acid ligase II